MKITNFADIEAEFIQRVHSMILCSAATIDSKNRPRSRILHPIWEGATGWIATHRHSHKSKHLARNPYMSLGYIGRAMQPVFVDCTTEWIDDIAQKQRIWEMFKNAPEPLGFDPAPTFISYDHEHFGLLKLTPWRIDLVSFPSESFEQGTRVWYAQAATE